MEDLRTGLIAIDGRGDADEIFTSRAEFGVDADDQRKFAARLRTARIKTKELNARSAFDDAAIRQDRLVFPVQNMTGQNKPRWDGSQAQELLRFDVAAKTHEAMAPQDLHNSRDEYKEFSLSTF